MLFSVTFKNPDHIEKVEAVDMVTAVSVARQKCQAIEGMADATPSIVKPVSVVPPIADLKKLFKRDDERRAMLEYLKGRRERRPSQLDVKG